MSSGITWTTRLGCCSRLAGGKRETLASKTIALLGAYEIVLRNKYEGLIYELHLEICDFMKQLRRRATTVMNIWFKMLVFIIYSVLSPPAKGTERNGGVHKNANVARPEAFDGNIIATVLLSILASAAQGNCLITYDKICRCASTIRSISVAL
jgi:hypothetical protein